MGSRGRDPGDGGIGPFNYPPPTIFLYMKICKKNVLTLNCIRGGRVPWYPTFCFSALPF